MPYKPPLHVINKAKPASPAPEKKSGPSREYKISMFTLSYRIKGMSIGLAAAILYRYFFLHAWSAKYLVAGPLLGLLIGALVGRFFYRDRD